MCEQTIYKIAFRIKYIIYINKMHTKILKSIYFNY